LRPPKAGGVAPLTPFCTAWYSGLMANPHQSMTECISARVNALHERLTAHGVPASNSGLIFVHLAESKQIDAWTISDHGFE
jgi:hypothetical protein